jgi:nucleoside phosphorylase
MSIWHTDLPCVVILTVLPIEYQAVCAHLTSFYGEVGHPQGSIYECGLFVSGEQSWRVALVQTDRGNAATAREAERAISYFKPSLMLFVGVAGGLKDVQLGDVVVGTKVYGYESGKAGTTFLTRPEVGNSTFRMVERAKAVARKSDWLHRLGPAVPTLEASPRIFVAPIAAGEKILSSTRSSVWKFLRGHYEDAVAVEMEGYGFLQTIHANQPLDALVIRGISDLIDDKAEADATDFQTIAAWHASAFAFEVLAKTRWKETAHPSASWPGQTQQTGSKYSIQIMGNVAQQIVGDNQHINITIAPQDKP